MSTKRVPTRRGQPARVEVDLSEPDRSDGKAVRAMIAHKRPHTFADHVADVERLCERIITKHGGRRGPAPKHKPGESWIEQGDFAVPLYDPDPASPVAYALGVAEQIRLARAWADAGNADKAMVRAWSAGALAVEAHFTRARIERARAAGKERKRQAVDDSRAWEWSLRVGRRDSDRSAEEVYREIAVDYPEVTAAAIKKAVQRYHLRAPKK